MLKYFPKLEVNAIPNSCKCSLSLAIAYEGGEGFRLSHTYLLPRVSTKLLHIVMINMSLLDVGL